MNTANFSFLRRQRDPLQIKRITAKNTESFSAYLTNPKLFLSGAGGLTAFGATLYGEHCGAVELRHSEQYLDLCSIQVDEHHRRGGVGTALLAKAKSFAAELDISKIYVEFMLDEEESQSVQAFLEANGFYLVETGNTLFTFKVADMTGSEMFQKLKALEPLKNVVHMDVLPSAVAEDLRRRAGNSIPEELLPWNAKGHILGDLSLGCVTNNRLGAFVIITEFNGRLYINSAYTDSEHKNHIVKLLAQALSTAAAKYAHYGEMCVTATNPASLNLIRKLAGLDLDKLERQTVRAMLWSLEDEQVQAAGHSAAAEAAQETVDGMEILVPKLMRLMDILEAHAMHCDLMLGDVPYLMVSVPGNYLMLRYLPMDDKFERFALTLSAFISTEKSAEELGAVCARINAGNLYTTAVALDQGLCLRSALPEAGFPVTEAQFTAFLDEFTRELAEIDLTATDMSL